MTLHALQRCATRGKDRRTICGLRGAIQNDSGSTGRQTYRTHKGAKRFRTTGHDDKPNCEHCLTIIRKGERT